MGKLRRRRRGGRGQRLLDVARALASTHDPDTILCYLVDSLTQHFHADRGFAILTEQTGGLDFGAALNVSSDPSSPLDSAVSHTIVEDVVRRRTPVLIRDASRDPVLREQSSVRRQGIRSVMCAPMIARGELMGVIYVDNLSKGDSFTDDDLNVLTLMCGYAGAALYNAKLIAAGADGARLREEAERLTALSQMAAGVAHDFKTVLGAIQGRLELMEMRKNPARAKHDLACALEAVAIGQDLLARMTDFAEVGYRGQASRVDVGEVVRSVVSLLAPRIEKGNCRLKLDVADGCFVRGQETQLGLVVMNLMTNALEAMGGGGTLSVSLESLGPRCVLRVRDTGHGIPDGIKERIFEPCFTTKGEGRMGLGLSLVHAIVSRHGGSIVVESAEGEGSEFRVFLPVAPEAAQE